MRKPYFERKSQDIEEQKTILIVCEGAKTEPYYFGKYQEVLYATELSIVGVGANTYTVVNKAIEVISEKEDGYYDQVWVVFDRDDFPVRNIQKAQKLAKDNNINIAFSHECFELWYLLHFDYLDIPIHREKYKAKLTQRMQQNRLLTQKEIYEKNGKNMFDLLDKFQSTAIQNCKRLEKHHHECGVQDYDIDKKKPYTSVYKLVEELNKNRRTR